MILIVLLLTVLLALPAEAARRVAVLDFENQSGGRHREEYSWIGLNVPETLAGKLSEVPGVQLIERAQWKRLVEELRLQLSDLFDEKKAAKIGGHLGANVVILGSFAVFEKRVNFNLRFVDVETARVLGALNRVSPIDDRLFEAFSSLALSAVEVLNRRVMGGEVASLPPDERLKVPEKVKEKIQAPPVKSLDAYTLLGKGKEAFDRHRWDEAISLYRQALALDPDYAEAWQGLGLVLLRRGKWDEAEEASRRALALFTKRGDEKGKGIVLSHLGSAATLRGRYEEAERLYQESLEGIRKHGSPPALVIALNHLGSLAMRRGRYGEAERLLEEGLAITRKMENEPLAALTLNSLGEVAERRGRLGEAERLYQESLAISRRLGNDPAVGRTLNNLGSTALRAGRPEEAKGLLEESLAVNRKIGNEALVGITLAHLGEVSRRRGRYAEAERLHQEGLGISRRLGNEPGVALTLFYLALLARDEGQREQAIRYARESLEISRRIGSPLAVRAEALLQGLGGG